MNLNNYIYSLFNTNVYNNFNLKARQSELIRSINTSVERTLESQYTSNDSISIESGKQLIQNQKHLASLTEIQGKNIKELYANNNILDLDTGSFYKLQTNSGTTAIYQANSNGNIYMPYKDLGLLDENLTLPPADYGEISKTSKILSGLAKDKTAFTVRFSGFSPAEIKDTLDKVGIKPGWFEIKAGTKSNRFYLTNGGLVYPEYQIQSQTKAFKDTNWFKDEIGYSSNSKFIIDGKTYKLDENGYLNLPDNVDCVMENIKIIK